MVNVWKYKLSKCKAHGGLRLIENRLFAAAGGYITTESIVNVSTRPPNSFTKDKDKIKFSASCEILGIDLVESYKSVPISDTPQVPLFINRDPPAPTIAEPITYTEQSINEMRDKVMNDQNSPKQPDGFNCTIYDSDAVQSFKNFRTEAKNKLVKIISSNGKNYITVKRLGTFVTPISMILPEKDYTVVLTTKVLSGNGKINVAISYGNSPPSYVSLLAERNFSDRRASLRTGQQTYPGEFFKINIAMLEDGVGEVIVSRIIIIENNFSGHQIIGAFGQQTRTAPAYSNIIRPIPREIATNYVSLGCFDPYSDQIKNHTKNAAIICADKFSPNNAFEFNTVIEPLTYSSRQWVGKINCLIKGLKIVDITNQMSGVEKTTEASTLVMSALGFLKPCKKIFVEEWNTRQKPSDADRAILGQCGTIITPSFVNYQILKQTFPSKEILCIPRMWPVYNTTPNVSERYFVYFEKFNKITDALINSWLSTYPKLYIVGSTAKIRAANTQHISEYVDYSELLSYIIGSQAIIDISDNNNYMSGINNLAIHNKINLITNNLAYFVNDYTTVKFINSTINSDGNLVIDQSKIQEAVELIISYGNITNQVSPDYISLFKQNIASLVG